MYDLTRFTDRGDPASVDFDQTTINIIDAWTGLDLRDIVKAAPKGRKTKAVLIAVTGRSAKAGTTAIFRGRKSKGDVKVGRVDALGGILRVNNDMIIPVGDDRIIEYYISGLWDLLQVTIKGWW